MRTALLITNIPTPYRLPLFNVLHRELKVRGIHFKVAFGALTYPGRQWSIDMTECEFPYEVLPTTRLRIASPERGLFTYQGLFRLLRREHAGAIIANGFSVATTKLWFRSLVVETPYIIWSGAIDYADQPLGSGVRWHRKALIHRATGFVAYGSRAGEYLSALGAPAENISIAINTVDTAHFAKSAEKRQTDNETDSSKQRLLVIGDLIPRKGIDRLLKIVQRLTLRRRDFILDIVGAGSEQARLERMAHDLGVTDYVNFVGFKQKAEMPFYLGRARFFIFPTHYDVWGLVLVEAMAAGLACISSVDAGATHDLVQDGQTGFAVDFSQEENVADKLHWLLDHPAECKLMGQRAKSFIEEHVSLKKSAEGFVCAIERVLIR